MAFVRSANLAGIVISKTEAERTFDHPTIDPVVTAMYREKGYDDRPKTAEEATARGLRDHNGLAVTAQELATKRIEHGDRLVLKLAPTRYLVRQAMADYVLEHEVTDHDLLGQLSPRIMGVSVLAPVRIKGEYFLVGQVKGKALGSGDIHFGYVAGGVRANDLKQDDPLSAALKHQVKDESGIDRDALNLTSFKYIVDERETGQINAGAVATGFDFAYALAKFEEQSKARLAESKSLEVNGFAPVRVQGLSIIPMERGQAGLADITCYLAGPNGIEQKNENRGIRPYSEAWVGHFADQRNITRFLQHAGF